MEFGKSEEFILESLFVNTSQKQMGLPKEPYREWMKGLMLYCCNQVWTTNGGQIPWNVIAICETFKISCFIWKHLRTAVRRTIYRTNNSVFSDGRISPYFCQRPVATASVRQESLPRHISRLRIKRGENLERRHCRRHWRLGGDGRIRTPRQNAQCEGSVNVAKKWNFILPGHRRSSQKFLEKISIREHPP